MNSFFSPHIHKNTKHFSSTLCLCVCVVILSSVCLQAQNAFDFSIQNQPIPEALRQLSEISKTNIAFSESFFPEGEKISFSKKNTTLKKCLEEILKDQPVDYLEAGGKIIIFKNEKYTISGFLTDESSGERLIYANIFTNHNGGTTTNEYGFYSLTLPAGAVKLSFSYIGYEGKDIEFDLSEDRKLNVKMPPSLMLSEVIVLPRMTNEINVSPTGLSVENFKIPEIEALPDFGGESDILRAATTLPGVQSGTDGTGGMYVRGGDADQNLMMLDGVPVYHSGHMISMFSIFNTHTIKSARFLKSGFPARYGGRLSSVFDVRTKEGNLYNWNASAETGYISSKVTVDGPFQKGKGAILISGRASNFEYLNGQLASLISSGEEKPTNPKLKREFHFYDLNAKANYDLGDNRFYLSYYFGQDRFIDEFIDTDTIERNETNAEAARWGNHIFSLRWNRLFNNQLFSNTTLTYTNYQFSYEQLNEDFSAGRYFFFGQFSDIRDINLNTDFDYRPSNNRLWRFGAGATYHALTPSEVFLDQEENEEEDFELFDFESLFENETAQTSTEAFVYVENEMKLSPSTNLAVGFRLSSYFAGDFYSIQPEPRFFVSQKLHPKFQLTASAGRMVQYLHRAVTTNLNLPDSKWIPSNDQQRPETSWQETFGFEYSPHKAWTVNSEIYHKTMSNQILFDFDTDGDPLKDFFIGSGSGYGWETMVEKTGKTGGATSYTLSRAVRVYKDFFSDDEFPFQFDRRHSFKIHLYHKFSPKFRVGTMWSYHSPNPIIPVLDKKLIAASGEQPNENLIPSSAQFVKVRIEKPIHRLDISAQYTLSKKRWEHQFKAGIYNIYNRKNIHFHKIQLIEGQDQPGREEVELFGITPSFSYRISFK